MSVRDQERRAQEAMRRSEETQTRINSRMQGAVRQADQASLRAEEVRRRIEVGDIEPRPLPSLREDSLKSSPSMKSMESSPSMKSTESADWWDKRRRSSMDYGTDYGTDYGSRDYSKDYNTDNRD
jgi:hypothetical protein